MDNIIAGTYQIIKKIGSGGGGIVYLAQHLRLNKQVVLKADRKEADIENIDAFRQEVDVLKNLRHSNIPQVYDYFYDNNTVYTVMDYIDGDSLDKYLKNQKSFTQIEMINIAIQVLSALQYLHTRPPYGILHADIKPANIMLTKSNEVVLIDYNISLALGETGSVKIGFSPGYASPEHYGLLSKTVSNTANSDKDDETMTISLSKASNEKINSSSKSSTSKKSMSSYIGKNGTILDVRSDIYSVGATLYHILTGKKPSKHYPDNFPISISVSKQIEDILSKSMQTKPDDRYQSANDMLNAFKNLHENDERSLKYKAKLKKTVAVFVAFTSIGLISTFMGLNRINLEKNNQVLSQEALQKYNLGDIDNAIKLSLKSIDKKNTLYKKKSTAISQKVLTDSLCVYDFSNSYNPYNLINLEKNPIDIKLSPDGKKVAVFCAYKLLIFDIDTAKQLIKLDTEQSSLCKMDFIDNDKIIYCSDEGLRLYDIKKEQNIWTNEKATNIAISGDKNKVFSIYKDNNYANCYDINTGDFVAKIDFGSKKQAIPSSDVLANANDSLFVSDKQAEHIAISFDDGSLYIYDLKSEYIQIFEKSNYYHYEGGFKDKYFAFVARDIQNNNVFAVIDIVNKQQVGGFSDTILYRLKIYENQLILSVDNLAVDFDIITENQVELAYTQNEIINYEKNKDIFVAITKDNKIEIFDKYGKNISSYKVQDSYEHIVLASDTILLSSQNKKDIRIFKKHDNKIKAIMTYDKDFVHDELRLSHDENTMILFNEKNFRIYDKNSKLISQVILENSPYIYDMQHRKNKDGSYLEVIYKDGIVIKYDDSTGDIISRQQQDIPSDTYEEEFFTDKYKIISKLHETAKVYDIKTSKEVAELEKDSYLTYVNQVEDYIITQYIDIDSKKYALILDKDLQVIAKLPNLSDISGNQLIFDDNDGNVYKQKIYTLEELILLSNEIMDK